MENKNLDSYNEDNQEIDAIEESEKDYNSNNDLNRLDVNYYTVERTIENLLKWIKNKKLEIPDFQRDFVWDYDKASLLIDSVLTNLPIPNVFVYREIVNQKERFILIDGKQRLTTFSFFVDEKFPDKKGKFKEFRINDNSHASWYKKKYSELVSDDKEAFDEYNIKLTVFENQKDVSVKEKNKAMYQIFKRVNTGADVLQPQEIRNAIYNGEILNLIKEYADDENGDYKRLISKDDRILKRYKLHEVILRFLTYYDIYIKYKKEQKYNELSKNDAINNYLDESSDNKSNFDLQFNKLKKALNVLCTFDDSIMYNVNRNKDGIGKRVHETFCEALIIAVIENEFVIKINKDEMKKKKIGIWQLDAEKKYFVSNTLSIEHINKRVDILMGIINGSAK